MHERELLHTRQIDTQSMGLLQLEYYCTKQSTEHGIQYGAAVRSICGGVEQEAHIGQITALRIRIEELLALLAAHTVTPVTLRDVVEDWL